MGEGQLSSNDRSAEIEWVNDLIAKQERKTYTAAKPEASAENPASNVDPKAEARMESQNKIDTLQREVDALTGQRDELLGQLKALKMMLQGNPADAEQLRMDEKGKSTILNELQERLEPKVTELKKLEAQHRTVFGLNS